MNLVQLYNSGSSTDIALFNFLFIFYGISSIALIFALLKLAGQQVSGTRFFSGILVFFIGSLAVFDIWFGLLKYLGQHYGQHMPISGPAVGVLLFLIGLSIGIISMFVVIQKLIYKMKDIVKPTIMFACAQPLLAIMFFTLLMFSGI